MINIHACVKMILRIHMFSTRKNLDYPFLFLFEQCTSKVRSLHYNTRHSLQLLQVSSSSFRFTCGLEIISNSMTLIFFLCFSDDDGFSSLDATQRKWIEIGSQHIYG